MFPEIHQPISQILAHRVRYFCCSQEFLDRLILVDYGPSLHESSNIFVKEAKSLLEIKKFFSIIYYGYDFQSISNNSLITQ